MKIGEEESFKLIIEHHGRTISYKGPFDTDVNQAIEAFYGLLVTDGYQEEDIKQSFIEYAEELSKKK